VLEEAIASRDEELVAGLTMTVATTMPTDTALTSLRRLSLVTTRQLMPAFLVLGEREPAALLAAYEQSLAEGTGGEFRAELVTGVGFRGGESGLETARLALGNDPDPAVRTRAMLVLTGRGTPAEGEHALMTLLDDPDFASHPLHLGEAVLALENLASRGDPNAVDRVGRRLLGNGALSPADRRLLEQILQRALPGRPTDKSKK
jgi:hypothetical protein